MDLLFFIFLPDPLISLIPVFFIAFIPFFFNDLRMGCFLLMTSLTTEDPNSLAAGLAALIIKGNILLATPEIKDRIPDPLRYGIPLGVKTEMSSNPAPFLSIEGDKNNCLNSLSLGGVKAIRMMIMRSLLYEG